MTRIVEFVKSEIAASRRVYFSGEDCLADNDQKAKEPGQVDTQSGQTEGAAHQTHSLSGISPAALRRRLRQRRSGQAKTAHHPGAAADVGAIAEQPDSEIEMQGTFGAADLTKSRAQEHVLAEYIEKERVLVTHDLYQFATDPTARMVIAKGPEGEAAAVRLSP